MDLWIICLLLIYLQYSSLLVCSLFLLLRTFVVLIHISRIPFHLIQNFVELVTGKQVDRSVHYFYLAIFQNHLYWYDKCTHIYNYHGFYLIFDQNVIF